MLILHILFGMKSEINGNGVKADQVATLIALELCKA